jgi:hypothetical protein
MTTPDTPTVTIEVATGGGADPWVALESDRFLSGESQQGSTRFDGVTVRYEPATLRVVLDNYDGLEQSPVGAGEDTGARLERWADEAQWPAELRDIDTGNTTLQATTLAGNARDGMLRTVDTEIGEMYFDGLGNLRFRRRHAMYLDTRSAVSQGTFSNKRGVGALPWANVVVNYDDQQLRNRIRISRSGGTLQEVEDVASQTRYSYDGAHEMPRTWGRSDLLMQTDDEALAFAQYVLYQTKDPDLRFDEMVIEPSADAANLFPQVLERKLGDRVTGKLYTPDGRTITRDVFIRGIRHTLSDPKHWVTTWVFQSATKFAFFVLDDPILGRLDYNALGY